MEINVSPNLCSMIPNFKLGIIHYDQINVGDSPQMVKGRLQLFQESIFFDLENKNVTELSGIQEWRQIFKTIGKDPNRYRHSAEALFRRVKKQNYLSSVNSAIDINNFFSLEYQVPIGIYDKANISGDITIRIGSEGEDYLGLNGRSNSLSNLIVAADCLGAFGSPYVDSERTAVTHATERALQIIYLAPSFTNDQAEKLTASLMRMFIQVHGGEASYQIVGC